MDPDKLTPDEKMALTPDEKTAYNLGFHAGQLATDAKLDDALKGLQRATVALKTLKRERDAILSEYARITWGKVCQGMVAAGYHPPVAHLQAGFAKRFGTGKCARCRPEMILWDELTEFVKRTKMQATWAAVMKDRAKRGLEKGFPIAEAGTTHKLGGVAKPTELAEFKLPGLNDSQQIELPKPE